MAIQVIELQITILLPGSPMAWLVALAAGGASSAHVNAFCLPKTTARERLRSSVVSDPIP